MPTGTVKWFDAKKGFGFIVGGEGEDVFVHFSVIQEGGFRALKDGEAVEYECERGSKGLSARNVRRQAPMPSAKTPQSEPPLTDAAAFSRAPA